MNTESATSVVAAFSDSHLYAQSVRNAHAEVVLVGKGVFYGELTKIDFPQLQLQRGHDTLARVAWVRNNASRVPIYFQTRTTHASLNDSGTQLAPGQISLASLGATYHSRSTGETFWGAMSLAPDDLAAFGRALIGRELTAPSVSHRLRPDPASMSRLLYLHASAGRLAGFAPQTLARPEVTHALEQQLLHAMVRCLAVGAPAETSTSHRRHTAILSRLEELLKAHSHHPLHLAEICTAIGVSERTLRLCSQEHLGMGPIQYLWLRRMNLAHRALLRADAATTVTEIATRHGFWELGRFAVHYRTLFGESPSVSLARPPVEQPSYDGHPFALDAPS